MDLKNTGIWSPMQTWWFMRRMDWKVADVHENAIINMCERSTVGNRPHQMQSWALAMRCGYALAKDLDQVLCKETPPEQCTQCEGLHQCSYMIFQLTIMEQNHHGSPCILGKNHQTLFREIKLLNLTFFGSCLWISWGDVERHRAGWCV